YRRRARRGGRGAATGRRRPPAPGGRPLAPAPGNGVNWRAETSRNGAQNNALHRFAETVRWAAAPPRRAGGMTSGILFAFAIAALSVAVIVGLVKRNRTAGPTTRGGLDSSNTVAQWTEGETTRLLSSA